VRTKRYAQAIEWLETALEIQPAHPLCAANLAYALVLTDPPRDPARALGYVEQALAAVPNDPTVLEVAYVVYRVNNQPQRAAAIVQRALQVIPQTHPGYQMWQGRQ